MLTVNEIFHSIQGESTHAGRPCVFVRLTACDLRCSWCDTPYAFHEGQKMSLEDVIGRVREYGCDVVEITGGEPLLQKEVYPLMQRLLDEGRTVMIETGGHLSVDQVPEPVIRVIDIKCPGSGEAGTTHWPNLDRLRATDEIKFVIKDRADYDYARDVVARHQLIGRCAAVHFSPVHGVQNPRELAEWILADRLGVRLQLQAHKYHLGSLHQGRVKAILLLSGGLDSFTAGAIARAEGYELYALTVRYGQVHAVEIEAARKVAAALGVARHLELDVPLAKIGGSALVGDGDIPKDRSLTAADIPSTYVPARNTVFLSLALAWAEVIGAEAIVIGVNALDYSGYPDCRPEYLRAFEQLAALATRAGVEGRPLKVLTPLLQLSKADIIRRGLDLGVDYGLTLSCYDPGPGARPCGRCDSCRLRARGFEQAGAVDPALPS